ncbi:unnamed protein product [Linum trigynum]|uniref:Uncharacterized protein n=1 Tax=Linum trigynum TaxID=586398 RepID=A0AAV2F8M0_9ROSI
MLQTDGEDELRLGTGDAGDRRGRGAIGYGGDRRRAILETGGEDVAQPATKPPAGGGRLLETAVEEG